MLTCLIRPLWKKMNDYKTDFIIRFLRREFPEIVLKYKDCEQNNNIIGTRVWMFWNTGFETAPPVVKQCIRRAGEIKCIDLVLLDSTNLYDYVDINPMLRRKYENSEITVQLYSDIIRNNLLNQHGGFWIDATGLVLDSDYVINHKNLLFYTAKHDPKRTLHFVKGLWSGFMIGAGKGNPMVAFASDFFTMYFNKFDRNFDYFFIDYVYLLAYRYIPAVKKQVDAVKLENDDVFALWHNFYNAYSDLEWNKIKQKNIFQKMIWKIDSKKLSNNCFYNKFVNGSNLF